MRPRRGAHALLLFVHSLFSLSASLILSAPEACGGTHVVTHATAFFGPKPGTSDVRDVLLFAPRSQVAGLYVRLVHKLPAKTPRQWPHIEENGFRRFWSILGALSIVKDAIYIHFEKLATSPTYARDAGMGVGGAADTSGLGAQEERGGKGHAVTGENDVASWEVDHEDRDRHVQMEALSEKPSTAQRAAMSVAADIVEHEASSSGNGTSLPFSLFDACTPLSVPADVATVDGRVVVVARGDCDFAQKVGIMQDAGAVGVIVVNFKDGGEHLANMKLNETKENPAPITIPAVMISYNDWATILPCRNDTMVVFTTEGEATFDIDYGRDALNWAMMRGMALWILCQCGVNVVRYKRRVSEFRARADAIAALPVDTYSRPQNHLHEESASLREEASRQEDGVTESVPAPSVAGPAPASPILDHDPERVGLISSDAESAAPSSSAGHAASSASTAVEDEGEPDEEEPVCAVCLEDFETGQQVRLLACSHLYHRSCIDPWLQSSSNCCPLCKREVPSLPPPPTQLHYGSMNV